MGLVHAQLANTMALYYLAVGLWGLVAGERNNNFGVFAAGALLAAIPTVALFQFLQRYIVGGLTTGAVKG